MESQTRRTFLITASAGAVALAASCVRPGIRSRAGMEEKDEEEVAPAEGLMREHGVLNRILLIYEEVGHRIRARKSFPQDILTSSAGIVQRFIEGYREKLEEDHLFPRFEKAGRLVDLVTVL